MGGGDVPPGFPAANPTTSHWQLPPHRIAHHRTTSALPTDIVHDYIIVGSGISGAATAYKLLSRDPQTSIVMLEARTAASGASGRNGGHCRPGWWTHFRRHCELYGEEEARRFEALEEGTVADIAAFVREHNVDNDFQDVETMDVYVTDEGWANAKEQLRFRQEVRRRTPGDEGPRTKHTVWEGEAASRHLGMPGIKGAITYPAHAQNPYMLVCRMLELAIDMGLNLQTETPALAVKREEQAATCWGVETERGVLRAHKVVLATNAYTNSLHAGLSSTGFLTPARSQVAAMQPNSRMDTGFLRGHSGGVVDVPTGDYYMTTPAGHTVWGGGRSVSRTSEVGITDDSTVNRRVAAYLHDAPGRLYGRDRWDGEEGVVRDWTGITCYTPDALPLVGEAPGEPGLWMTVGMNGHGMAMAFRCARALVEMMSADGKGEPPAPGWFPRCMALGRAWDAAAVKGRVEMEWWK